MKIHIFYFPWRTRMSCNSHLEGGSYYRWDRHIPVCSRPTTPSWLPSPKVEGHLSFIIAPALWSALHLACLAHLCYLPHYCRHWYWQPQTLTFDSKSLSRHCQVKQQGHMGSRRTAWTTHRRKAGSLFFEDLLCGSEEFTTSPVKPGREKKSSSCQGLEKALWNCT